MRIDTRELAISHLIKKGFYAVARDWAMGETILTAARTETDETGIVSLICPLYLYPINSIKWGISQGMVKFLCCQNLDECIRISKILILKASENNKRFVDTYYIVNA